MPMPMLMFASPSSGTVRLSVAATRLGQLGYRRQHVSIAMAAQSEGKPPTAAMVWFRNDLRLADHAALHAALSSQPSALLPLYCLDERELHPRLLPDEDHREKASDAPADANISVPANASIPAPTSSLTADEGGAGRVSAPASPGSHPPHSPRGTAAKSSGLGVPKLGPYRLRALLEALSALDEELKSRGSQLAFHQGIPEAVLGRAAEELLRAGKGPPGLASPWREEAQREYCQEQPRPLKGPQSQFGALELHYHLEPGPEAAAVEAAVEAAVQAAATKQGAICSIHRHWGATLYHPDDLPYCLFEQQGSRKGKSNSSGGAQAAGGGPQPRQQQDSREEKGGNSVGVQAAGGGAQPRQQQGSAGAECHRALVHPHRFKCLPRVMTDFRKVAQANTRVRRPLPKPSTLSPLPAAADPGVLLGQPLPSSLLGVYEAAGAGDSLQRLESLAGFQLGALPPPGTGPVHANSAVPFTVGEAQGLRRLRYYLGLEDSDGISQRGPHNPRPMDCYQESRMTPWGVDNSAKLSPFLSLGCLSPRTGYWEALRAMELEGGGKAGAQHAEQAGAQQGAQRPGPAGVTGDPGCSMQGQRAQQEAQHVQQQEQQRKGGGGEEWGEEGREGEPAWREPVKGDSVRWLLMHLGIRDFFIFTALKDGEGLLRTGGRVGQRSSWRTDEAALHRWAQGQTGLPFVDACMRELAATGFMSNRGRQNVASLLAKGLSLDWRLGAALFESLLVDHDYALNMGNWSYVAGTGNDPRDRQFKTVSQGEAYDPQAHLIRAWVSELSHLPAALAHKPWEAGTPEMAALAGPAGAAAAGVAAAPAGAEVLTAGLAAGAVAAAVSSSGSLGLHGGRGSRAGGPYPAPIIDPSTQIRRVPWQKKG